MRTCRFVDAGGVRLDGFGDDGRSGNYKGFLRPTMRTHQAFLNWIANLPLWKGGLGSLVKVMALASLVSVHPLPAKGVERPKEKEVLGMMEMRQAVSAFRSGIRKHAVRLGGLDKDIPGLEDLVRGKSVVGLGEETHGTAEFGVIQANFVRQLVKFGFRDIALELSPNEMEKVDAFFRGDSGMTAKEAVMGMVGRATPETAMLYAWVKEYNQQVASSDRIRIWSVDNQDISALASYMLASLKKVGCPDEALRAVKRMEEFATLTERKAWDEDPRKLMTKVDAYLAQSALGIIGAELESRPELYDRQFRMALSGMNHRVQYCLAYLNVDSVFSWRTDMFHASYRDRAMAEAILSLVRDGRKVIYIAHNAHIQRGGMITSGGVPCETVAGDFLAMWMPDAYLAIGLKTGHGTVTAIGWDAGPTTLLDSRPLAKPGRDTMEGAFESVSRGEPLLVDFRKFPMADMALPERLVGFECGEEEDPRNRVVTIPNKAYDVIVFSPKSTATRVFWVEDIREKQSAGQAGSGN